MQDGKITLLCHHLFNYYTVVYFVAKLLPLCALGRKEWGSPGSASVIQIL